MLLSNLVLAKMIYYGIHQNTSVKINQIMFACLLYLRLRAIFTKLQNSATAQFKKNFKNTGIISFYNDQRNLLRGANISAGFKTFVK